MGLAALLLPLADCGAQQSGDLIPSSPQALLDALPVALPRWSVTRSEARSYVAGGFYAQAMREFTEILPPEVAANTRTPLKVIVELRDTCESENQLRPFRMTPEQLLAANLKMGQWRDLPALKVNDGAVEREAVRILLRGRWILQVVYSGRDFRAAEHWLDQIDLAKINNLHYRRYAADPEAVPIVHVNEVDPTRSRRYFVSVTTRADLDAMTKRIEAEYRELGWELPKDTASAPNPEPKPEPTGSGSP